MIVETTPLRGLLIIRPKVFKDSRGFFAETWHSERYSHENSELKHFVQDNVSRSCKGTLRGLHFQEPHPQAKLVTVFEGRIFDVAVDLRVDSPTRGKHFAIELSSDALTQVFIPAGFAHGFYVLSNTALFSYKCSDFYSPEHEKTLLWNDPELKIPWPLVGEPILSQKDRLGTRFKEL